MIYTVYKGNVNIILWNDLFWLACIVNVILKTHIICSWIMNFCYIVICNNASRFCFIRSILTRTIYSTLFFVNNKYFGVNICYCFVAISFFFCQFFWQNLRHPTPHLYSSFLRFYLYIFFRIYLYSKYSFQILYSIVTFTIFLWCNSFHEIIICLHNTYIFNTFLFNMYTVISYIYMGIGVFVTMNYFIRVLKFFEFSFMNVIAKIKI